MYIGSDIMLTKRNQKQTEVSLVILEDFVPKDHLLRKVNNTINFNFIYEIVEPLYSSVGRPSIDPVVLFKLVFINHFYGYNSMRRTIEETKVNLAFRWFIGYGIDEKIPHFSDFSKNLERKFLDEIKVINPITKQEETTTVFRAVFDNILFQIQAMNYVYPAHIYMDSTHIKANANKQKIENIEIVKTSRSYQEALDQELNSYSEDNDLSKASELKEEIVTVKKPLSDPEAGIFMKGEHERQIAYTAQTICDINGFILDTEVSPANMHDSTTFYTAYNRVIQTFGVGGEKGIRSIGLDAGYKTAAIAHRILEDQITPLLPYTRPKGVKKKEDKFSKKDFTYDKSADVYQCPNGNQLTPRSVNRKSGCITYQGKTTECKNCPFRNQCLSKTSKTKTLTRHIWQSDMAELELIRGTEYHKRYYSLRKETIERVFADGKEKHGLRYTRYKGKRRVQGELLLLYACMNMKKAAMWAAEGLDMSLKNIAFSLFYQIKTGYMTSN